MTNSPDNAQPAPRPVTTAEHDVLMAAARDGMTLASKGRLVATPTAQAAPALHPKTADLVQRFSAALAEKLAAAEKKYGYSDGWASPDWMDECRQHLNAHIAKGDPRDVAAYCAFLWHHGASTAAPAAPHPIAPDVAADLERSDWTPEEALRWYAAGKHYDTVPNGDGSSSARILDNGAVASNALKSLSRDYAEHKGDAALMEAPAAGAMNTRRRITGQLGDPATAEAWLQEHMAAKRAAKDATHD